MLSDTLPRSWPSEPSARKMKPGARAFLARERHGPVDEFVLRGHSHAVTALIFPERTGLGRRPRALLAVEPRDAAPRRKLGRGAARHSTGLRRAHAGGLSTLKVAEVNDFWPWRI